jgi:Pyridoxamine 5'-phosphate oxidase
VDDVDRHRRNVNVGLVTASLPHDVQSVFERFITTEFTTIDGRGQPITWPVTPYYHGGERCVDVTTGVGYPKKADDARRNPHVSLLFSDPTGSRIENAPMVLVQGTARVDEEDLKANRERYVREALAKLPAAKKLLPPKAAWGLMGWYLDRIYVHVWPERVYVWADGDATREPQLYDAHIEEVRSGHSEEPAEAHAPPDTGVATWDERMDELGSRYRSAVISLVSPDGFPFSLRVPVRVDRQARRVRIDADALGVPVQPGLACLCAHDHSPDFTWQRNFQVRGDLVEDEQGWSVVPHKLIGGFELPPTSMLKQTQLNWAKYRRYYRTAKRRARA